MDFWLPGTQQGLWVSNLGLTSSPSSWGPFLVSISQVCFSHHPLSLRTLFTTGGKTRRTRHNCNNCQIPRHLSEQTVNLLIINPLIIMSIYYWFLFPQTTSLEEKMWGWGRKRETIWGNSCLERQQKLGEQSWGSYFHILAFLQNKSGPKCLPWERKKRFHFNCLHVQSWKAKLHMLVA